MGYDELLGLPAKKAFCRLFKYIYKVLSCLFKYMYFVYILESMYFVHKYGVSVLFLYSSACVVRCGAWFS